MRVLAVGAHPDDLETSCCGTLARYVAGGHHVTMCVASDGAAGHRVIPPTELRGIREAEARKSADLLGADFVWLGLPDGLLFDDQATRLAFVDMIRLASPDLIITHSPDDYHPDHRMVSKLIFDASFVASVPNIKTQHPAHSAVVPIFTMDTLAGKGFHPAEYVDITSTMETKRKMLSCHESQAVWLKDHDNIDIMEFMESLARARGFQCNVLFAEGFCSNDAWPRKHTKRLLP